MKSVGILLFALVSFNHVFTVAAFILPTVKINSVSVAKQRQSSILQPSCADPVAPSPTSLSATAAGKVGWTAALAAGKQYLHADPSFVLTSVFLMSIFGVWLERRTVVGKALSVCTSCGFSCTPPNPFCSQPFVPCIASVGNHGSGTGGGQSGSCALFVSHLSVHQIHVLVA